MWERLVAEVLGTLESPVAKALLSELEALAEQIAVKELTKLFARAVLKSIDGVVAAGVKVLDGDTVLHLSDQHRQHIEADLEALGVALEHYVPLQIAVEEAKHAHGDHSPEADAARKARQVGIDEIRKDVGDIFAELIGEHVATG